MSVNAYLQRVIKNSPSKLTARAAKVIHRTAATADNLIGHSAKKTWNNASMATRMHAADPSRWNARFSERVQKLAVNQAQKTKDTRIKAGLIAGAGAVAVGAKKALQPPENNVYYDPY